MYYVKSGDQEWSGEAALGPEEAAITAVAEAWNAGIPLGLLLSVADGHDDDDPLYFNTKRLIAIVESLQLEA